MPSKPNVKYTREQIDELLLSHHRAVEVGIVRLYQLQTEDEKQSEQTHHDNNKGFQSCYAKKGTKMAKSILEGWSLTEGYWKGTALKICLKHSRQLRDIANGDLTVPEIDIPKTKPHPGAGRKRRNHRRYRA